MWFSELNTIKFKEAKQGSDTNTATLKKDRLVRIPYNTAISIQSELDFGTSIIELCDIFGNRLPNFIFYKDCRRIMNTNKYHTILKIKKRQINPRNAKVRFRISRGGSFYYSKLFYLCSEFQNNKIVTTGRGVAFDGTILSDYTYRESYSFYHYCDFSIFQKQVEDTSVLYNDNNGTVKNLRANINVYEKCYFGNKYYLPEWQAIALKACLRFTDVYVLFWAGEKKTIVRLGYHTKVVRAFKTVKLECSGDLELEYISNINTNSTVYGNFNVHYDTYSSIIKYEDLDLTGINISQKIPSLGDIHIPIRFLTDISKKVKYRNKVIDFSRLPAFAVVGLNKLDKIPDNFLNEKESKEFYLEDYTPFKEVGDNTFDNVEFWDGTILAGEVKIGKNFHLLSGDMLILSQPEIDGVLNQNIFLTKPATVKNTIFTTDFQNRRNLRRVENCKLIGTFQDCEIINCEATSSLATLSFSNCSIINSFNTTTVTISARADFREIKNSFNRINIINSASVPMLATTIEDSFLQSIFSKPTTLALSNGTYDNSRKAGSLTITAENNIRIGSPYFKNVFWAERRTLDFNNQIANLPKATPLIVINIKDGKQFDNYKFCNFDGYSPARVMINYLTDFYPSPNSFVNIADLTIKFSDFVRIFPIGNLFNTITKLNILDDVDMPQSTMISYISTNLAVTTEIRTTERIIDILEPIYPDITYTII